MKRIGRLISGILTAAMLFSSIAAVGFAAEADENLAVSYPSEKLDLWAVKHDSVSPNVTVTASSYHQSFGKPSSVLDGAGMIGTQSDVDKSLTLTDGYVINGEKEIKLTSRWVSATKDSAQWLNFKFDEAIKVKQISWTEVRKVIGEFEFVFYKDGKQVYTQSGKFTDGTPQTAIFLREVELDSAVEADQIEFKMNTRLNSNIIQVVEMVFGGPGKGASSFSATSFGGENDISEGLKNAFDGKTDTAYTVKASDTDGTAEITFGLSETLVADALSVETDGATVTGVLGSLDGKKFFEIDFVEDGGIYRFSGEYLKAVKLKLTLTPDCENLSISEIGLYEKGDNDKLHRLSDLFDGSSASYITDEDTDGVTGDIKSLPASLGEYGIVWESSDSSIINVQTGAVTQSYIAQKVTLCAKFVRDGETYRTNEYLLTVADDGSMEKNNKLNRAGSYEPEMQSRYIVSSSAWDANEKDPWYSAFSQTSALYDEAGKTENFSSDNSKSWGTYPMNDAAYVFKTPITIQFDFVKDVPLSGLDIYEFRDRVKKGHIEISSDGEEWTVAKETSELSVTETIASEYYKKSIDFPLCWAKHVRFVIDELAETTQYAAFKLCEFAFRDEQADPAVNSMSAPAMADRDRSTFAEVKADEEIVIDLGSIKGFDGIKQIADGGSANEYEISVSNDGIKWTGEVSAAPTVNESVTSLSFDYKIARFIKLKPVSVSGGGSIKIYELYVSEDSSDERFGDKRALAGLIEADSTEIMTDDDLMVLTADSISLPTSVGDYSLSWDLSGADMIDEQGVVTHGDEDAAGVIGVSVIDKTIGCGVYSNTFNFVSKAIYNADDYYIAAEKDSVSDKYDFDRPDGFLFNQKDMVLEFTLSGEGEASVNSDGKLFDISADGEKITVSYGGGSKELKYGGGEIGVRALLGTDAFDLCIDTDGTRYRGVISGAAYLSGFDEGIRSIEGEMVKDVRLGIRNDQVVDFLNQMDFSNISGETMYSVTKDLTLLKEIIKMPVTWTSSSAAISADTGAVDFSADPHYAVLNAKIDAEAADGWSKKFYVAVNLPNVISKGVVSANAVSYNGNGIENAADAKLSTSFLTSYKNGYSVQIVFPESTLISQVALIEDNQAGCINSYNIYVDDKKVYSGEKPNGFGYIVLDGEYGTKVKIEVTSSEGITGFKEIAVHSELTAAQRAKLDADSISISSNYNTGEYKLPATGTYGSAFTYTASKTAVAFEKAEDGVVMKVKNPGVATSVVISAVSNYEGNIAERKFTIVVGGEKSISVTPSSGGSRSYGGSAAGTGSVPRKDESGNGETQTPDTTDEITGHWAEAEIRSLIEKGIVKGDEDGYDLSSTVSRAEFITMALRAVNAELSENTPAFEDVAEDAWYASAMQTAYELGWIEGFENRAEPTAKITREELAKIVCSVLKIDTLSDEASDFTDRDQESPWAAKYINALRFLNIINGYEDGTFRPKNVLKRDEAMVVIFRILNTEVK